MDRSLCALILTLIVLLPDIALARLRIPVAVISSVPERYARFLAEKGMPAEDVTDLKSVHANRQVADLVIIKQALQAGGLPADLLIIEVPNAARERLLVESGAAVISGQDLFAIAFPDGVYKSSPVIPEGAFVKGIYGRAENSALRNVSSLNELRQFTAVSFSGWKVDWLTLNALKPAELVEAATLDGMFRLVGHRGIDFTLCEFPASEDLSVTVGDITLHPVPHVVVALKGSRHFMVSRQHPDGPRVFEALEKGLGILHGQGRIARYLTEAGVFNPAVSTWKVLAP